jgi:hypothetical protein
LGDAQGSEEAFARADALGDAEAAYALGLIYDSRGATDAEAEAAFRRADERGHAEAPYMIGVNLLARGELDEAAAAAVRADERGSGNGAFLVSVVRAGNPAESLRALRRAEARGHTIDAALMQDHRDKLAAVAGDDPPEEAGHTISPRVVGALAAQLEETADKRPMDSPASFESDFLSAWQTAMDWEAQSDSESEPSAPSDAKAYAVHGVAHDLAMLGRQDQAAVDELRTAAQGELEALIAAERIARVGGKHRESLIGNRLHGLIVAAIDDQPIKPLDPEDALLFDSIAAFNALAPPDRWTKLTTDEPRLADLERELHAGQLLGDDSLHQHPGAAAAGGLRGQRWFLLAERIGALLGPNSRQPNTFLRSRTARDAAMHHLTGMPPASSNDVDTPA